MSAPSSRLRWLGSPLVVGISLLIMGLSAPAPASPVVPDFASASFSDPLAIDNPYFPLVSGTVHRYSADVIDPEDPEETAFLEIEDFVTFDTETVAGVTARVVRAREWEDGLLVEDTFDWYAQDDDGNVWYLGEDTTAFEYDDEGNLVGTDNEGAWRAGEDGAQPGFIMPAFPPTIGFNYYQEFAPADEAVDQATILSTDNTVTVPAGIFANVLKTLEFTELEPGVFEHKLYAPGVGLVLIEEDLDDQGVPLNPIPLRSATVVPLPAAAVPGLIGLAAIVGGRWLGMRRRRT